MKKSQLYFVFITIITDYFLVVVAFFLAYEFRDSLNGGYLIPFDQFIYFSLLTGILYVGAFALTGQYAIEKRYGLVDQFFGLVMGSLFATVIAGAFIYFAKSFDYSRLIVGVALILAVFLVLSGRIVLDRIEREMYQRKIGVMNVLIIGRGKLLEMAVKSYKMVQERGYEIAGVIVIDNYVIKEGGVTVLGNLEKYSQLDEIIRENEVQEVVMAHNGPEDDETMLEVMGACERTDTRFKYVPGMTEVMTSKLVASELAGMPVVEVRPTLLEGWMILAKRLIDLVATTLGLVVLSPLFLVIAIAIKIDSQGPIFFAHKRVGKSGAEFSLYKFRSMKMLEKDGKLLHSNENKEVEKLKEKQSNYKLENDPRVTRVGAFIRKTSIDELPQLWNVLRGEMSLVGPRAYLRKELDKQQQTFPQTRALVRRLLTVKPGITGLWQVSGRSNIDFTERVSMDAYYATNANIWLDIKLLIQTIPVVLRGSGAM